MARRGLGTPVFHRHARETPALPDALAWFALAHMMR